MSLTVNPNELIAELLRNAASICATGGLLLEDFVELAAHAYAAAEGDRLDSFKFECTVAERPPAN